MKLRVLTSIKYWWRNHKWVDTRKNYVLSHDLDVFWLNKEEIKAAEKFKEENPSRFYQYCFTPGPIGVCKRIRGGENGEQDITDYGSW